LTRKIENSVSKTALKIIPISIFKKKKIFFKILGRIMIKTARRNGKRHKQPEEPQ
jgi:hypothetical protein